MSDSFPRLETDRLILRAAKLSDAEALYHVYADADVTRYLDLEAIASIEQARRIILHRSDRFRSGQAVRWGIALKSSYRLIGSCGFSLRPGFRAEIGYELAPAYWRQGIMSEALTAIIGYGWRSTHINRFEAFTMLENTASAQLLLKLGFQEEGILRDYGFWKGTFHDLRSFALLRGDRSAK
ncbi:GNAT family N-acetyltransferase [Microcoleus sp. FACHB-1515]|uniref:GNAT family N-acetyltransferase n=1 Tax=Cyanophyceae TaxID=3028117 RepID=UPI00168590DB|nr:GNAT family protein [Microcoleus sp. FACHB-1515]MBD2091646.1 GNAT family N-acetyltransferase [Microcoleus sp. FACHB-1515]